MRVTVTARGLETQWQLYLQLGACQAVRGGMLPRTGRGARQPMSAESAEENRLLARLIAGGASDRQVRRLMRVTSGLAREEATYARVEFGLYRAELAPLTLVTPEGERRVPGQVVTLDLTPMDEREPGILERVPRGAPAYWTEGRLARSPRLSAEAGAFWEAAAAELARQVTFEDVAWR